MRKLYKYQSFCFGLVLFRIYVSLAVFQPYRDLEAGDNKSLKFKWRGGESNPGPLAPQAKSLTTRPPPLPSKLLEFISRRNTGTDYKKCNLLYETIIIMEELINSTTTAERIQNMHIYGNREQAKRTSSRISQNYGLSVVPCFSNRHYFNINCANYRARERRQVSIFCTLQ